MSPRAFLNFLHTRSGKLLLFGCILAAGLALYGRVASKNHKNGSVAARLFDLGSRTNKPQVIETVLRNMSLFRPPAPKPEPKPALVATNQTETTKSAEPAPVKPPETPYVPPPPLNLFADTTSQEPEPRKLGPDYAPYGRLIPCETVITVDSSSIRTPIIGLVTEDIYHAGRLVIPAGTEVHGTAAADRVRERLASGMSWTLVWQTGEELRLNGLALDREFESGTNQAGWGITDGSAGLRGRVIKSDDLAEIKLFAASFLSGAAGALTGRQQTLLGPLASPTLGNAPLEGAQAVLQVYAQHIYDSIQRDGFYVRVPSGKQFYLYILQTIDRADARLAGSGLAQTNEWARAEANPSRAQTDPVAPILTKPRIPVQP